MIINRFPTIFGILVVLSALAVPVRAAETAPEPGMQREFAARMKVCEACHGENGVPKNATIPTLLGQQESYLVKQLHDFQSGDRKVEVMSWMAKALTEEELNSAASYLSKKNWPARSAAAAAATPPKGVVVCQACHQLNFGGGQVVPRLAGQNYDYLVESMRRFAEGERTNSSDMVQIMKAMSPADRETMARYISGL